MYVTGVSIEGQKMLETKRMKTTTNTKKNKRYQRTIQYKWMSSSRADEWKLWFYWENDIAFCVYAIFIWFFNRWTFHFRLQYRDTTITMKSTGFCHPNDIENGKIEVRESLTESDCSLLPDNLYCFNKYKENLISTSIDFFFAVAAQ